MLYITKLVRYLPKIRKRRNY